MTATQLADADTAQASAADVSPEHILTIGMGFWASTTLLSAVALGLFSVLGAGGLTASEIARRLDLHERGRDDFLGAFVTAGSDYTGAQFDTWARTAGFARTEIRHLAGPGSVAIAYKN